MRLSPGVPERSSKEHPEHPIPVELAQAKCCLTRWLPTTHVLHSRLLLLAAKPRESGSFPGLVLVASDPAGAIRSTLRWFA